MKRLIRYMLTVMDADDETSSPEPEFSPSLDFSDARNSQFCSLWG